MTLKLLCEAFYESGLKFRLWFQDEARVGLYPRSKRVLTARGVKPTRRQGPIYQSKWIYGSIEPATGQSHFMYWSHLEGQCMQAYIDNFSKCYPGQLHVMVMDGASAHTSNKVVWPDNVIPIILPAYSPELNPVERLWQEMRRYLKAWYSDMDKLMDDLDWWVEILDENDVQSVSSYPYILAALSHC